MICKGEIGMMMAATVHTRLPEVGQGLRWKRENLGRFGGNRLSALGPCFD